MVNGVKRYEYRRESLWRPCSMEHDPEYPVCSVAERVPESEVDATAARLGAEGWLLAAMDDRNLWFVKEVA